MFWFSSDHRARALRSGKERKNPNTTAGEMGKDCPSAYGQSRQRSRVVDAYLKEGFVWDRTQELALRVCDHHPGAPSLLKWLRECRGSERVKRNSGRKMKWAGGWRQRRVGGGQMGK